MKLEIKKDMYIRTKNGIIDKVLFDYSGHCADPKCECKHICCDKDYYDEDIIVKASYNIIDILEVGDVIIDKEGHKYPINYEFETDYNSEYSSYEITIDDHITLFLKDGLSIVTHEQMEQMAYKVEEND